MLTLNFVKPRPAIHHVKRTEGRTDIITPICLIRTAFIKITNESDFKMGGRTEKHAGYSVETLLVMDSHAHYYVRNTSHWTLSVVSSF